MRLGRVCVFCGSSTGESPLYRQHAEQLADVMLARRIDLVYGGGCVGLMGILADAVLKGGGHVIGVIPDTLVAREVAHLGLPDLRVVSSMHERKALMASLADAFLALPGGFGTFEELFEALTWTQLGLHAKRCGLLNIGGFYDPLLALLDESVRAGFLKPENRLLLDAATDPEALLDALAAPMPPRPTKWIQSPEQT
jgi:uncharacterized protein (TIGR00730 family)